MDVVPNAAHQRTTPKLIGGLRKCRKGSSSYSPFGLNERIIDSGSVPNHSAKAPKAEACAVSGLRRQQRLNVKMSKG